MRISLLFFLLFSFGCCFSQSKRNETHKLELRNGSVFSITILEINDSTLVYSSGYETSSIPLKEISKITILANGVGRKQRNNPYFNAIDTTKIWDSTKMFFTSINTGIKFGVYNEFGFNRPTSSFVFDFGVHRFLNKHHILGASVGFHPFSLYEAINNPVKLEYKFIVKPNEKKSLALNAHVGYNFALLGDNFITDGGIHSSAYISIINAKKPLRCNEFRMGFTWDRFTFNERQFNRWPQPIQTIPRSVFANRFFISYSWWFR